jgi:hypothetical protein
VRRGQRPREFLPVSLGDAWQSPVRDGSATGRGRGLAGRRAVRFDAGMGQDRGPTAQPSGWALFWPTMRELWRDMRYPTPRPLRYLPCDGCGQVTQHSADQRELFVTGGVDLTSTPPQTVCDDCGHCQLRTVDDEVPQDATVTCTGRRHRRFRAGRSRRPCGHGFAAPRTAPLVLCPWCSTRQPGTARP